MILAPRGLTSGMNSGACLMSSLCAASDMLMRFFSEFDSCRGTTGDVHQSDPIQMWTFLSGTAAPAEEPALFAARGGHAKNAP